MATIDAINSKSRIVRAMRAAMNHRLGVALWQMARRVPFLQRQWAKLTSQKSKPRDLQAIAALTLVKNENFLAARKTARDIEGMFSDLSMAIVDSLLSLQEEVHIYGNMLEFGVYKGRSAALIGQHLRNSERLVLVDVTRYLDNRAIALFCDRVDFILTSTEKFRKVFAGYRRKKHSFRFIHIDASHGFRATFNELRMADDLLTRDGIIALDDFTNLNYSQNIAAIFKYLYSTGTNLTPFLVTDEKAYLCRKGARAFYAEFILDRLIAEMGSRDIPDICLARTDQDPEYRAFYAHARQTDQKENFYGVELYRDLFQSP